jgi:hypothetical protein
MAKITFIDPVKSVSGKLSKASTVTFMRRQAETSNIAMLENPNYTHIMGKRKSELSPSEVEYRTRFGNICVATQKRLKDATKKNDDIAAFNAQSQYSTLRQFVWHQCADEIA